MDWLPHIGIGFVVLYLLLCLLFYFGQDFLFFRPEKLPQYFRYRYPFPFEEITLSMEDGGSINGLLFTVPNARGVVFYFKGNSRSIKGWGKFARDFIGKGYDFFVIDYRGFGKSRGKRTESILYNDAQHVYKWLTKHYAEDKIVIYGRSLGSGIATRIASWNDPRLLILDSPYYSFLHQVRRYGWWLPVKWLLRYQIRSDQFIRKITCPIVFIHGTKDRLIPFSNSEKLLKQASAPTHLFPIEKAHHNDLPDFPMYHEVLYDILNDDQLLEQLKETNRA